LPERLKDVKGIDEVREEVEEVIKMLKNPTKYENAGAKLVRGILLIGKPGTGKTLLARALAGESGVNFIYVSASEFDKGLVGMGNKLLKNLFRQARENKPCIIFIDEIDTLLHSGRRQG
jgi:ATP-dependent Zn protease